MSVETVDLSISRVIPLYVATIEEEMYMEALTLGSTPNALPPGVAYFVREAHALANELGPSGALRGRASQEEADAIVTRGSTDSILLQRDAMHRRGVSGALVDVLAEAMLLGYDITNPRMERVLMAIAVEVYTSGYTPMRVLGTTGEGFKR